MVLLCLCSGSSAGIALFWGLVKWLNVRVNQQYLRDVFDMGRDVWLTLMLWLTGDERTHTHSIVFSELML